MTTNQASGGVRRRSERSQGRRQNNVAKGTAPPPFGRGRLTVSTANWLLALDRGPGRNPLVIGNAVLASVRARGHRRFPEVDRLEVGARLVRVVLGARARLQGFHLGARLAVDRGLAEEQSLLSLNLRGAHPLGPLVGAVGVRRLGGEHPGVAPSGRAFARDGVRERPAVALELDRLVRPRGADESVAVLEIENLLRRGGPVFL